MERYFWIGYSEDNKTIVTMTLKNEPPQEMKTVCGFKEGTYDELEYKTYTNFVPITKEEVLQRQREGFKKFLELK